MVSEIMAYQRFLLTVAVVQFVLVLPARAAITGPYDVDADTLHLWHMEEPNGTPLMDSAGDWHVGKVPDKPVEVGPPQRTGTDSQELASYPGFGEAIGMLAPYQDQPFANYYTTGITEWRGWVRRPLEPTTELRDPETGAFTFEAIINVNDLQTEDSNHHFIMSLEDSRGRPKIYSQNPNAYGIISAHRWPRQ